MHNPMKKCEKAVDIIESMTSTAREFIRMLSYPMKYSAANTPAAIAIMPVVIRQSARCTPV